MLAPFSSDHRRCPGCSLVSGLWYHSPKYRIIICDITVINVKTDDSGSEPSANSIPGRFSTSTGRKREKRNEVDRSRRYVVAKFVEDPCDSSLRLGDRRWIILKHSIPGLIPLHYLSVKSRAVLYINRTRTRTSKQETKTADPPEKGESEKGWVNREY